jgi:hypothetical protein
MILQTLKDAWRVPAFEKNRVHSNNASDLQDRGSHPDSFYGPCGIARNDG